MWCACLQQMFACHAAPSDRDRVGEGGGGVDGCCYLRAHSLNVVTRSALDGRWVGSAEGCTCCSHARAVLMLVLASFFFFFFFFFWGGRYIAVYSLQTQVTTTHASQQNERSKIISEHEVGCSSVGLRASDRHATDAGSVPRCGKEFFFLPRVNFQRRFSYGVRTAPVCNRMHLYLCAR